MRDFRGIPDLKGLFHSCLVSLLYVRSTSSFLPLEERKSDVNIAKLSKQLVDRILASTTVTGRSIKMEDFKQLDKLRNQGLTSVVRNN